VILKYVFVIFHLKYLGLFKTQGRYKMAICLLHAPILVNIVTSGIQVFSLYASIAGRPASIDSDSRSH
jgi:hypothetical protein